MLIIVKSYICVITSWLLNGPYMMILLVHVQNHTRNHDNVVSLRSGFIQRNDAAVDLFEY